MVQTMKEIGKTGPFWKKPKTSFGLVLDLMGSMFTSQP
jgi:hypothetical protein